MATNHFARMLADAGACAYWARVYLASSSDNASETYIWQDLIHNRDYRTHEIAKSEAKCFWEPQWDNATPTEIKNGAPYVGALDIEPGNSGGSPIINANWRLIPFGTTQFYGYGNNNPLSNQGNNASPLRQRFNDDDQVDAGALPGSGSSRPTTTIPGCFNIPDGKNLQAENINFAINKIVNSFPFTLEAWARPGNGNSDDMAGNSDGNAGTDNGYSPHNVMMIACPNPTDANPGEDSSLALPAGAPDSSWRHWGIGFAEGQTGVPVIHWGGWKTLGGGNNGQEALHVAGPDPSRQYKPDHTGNENNTWAHIVGVFHSRTEVQLFYNGVEVAYYKDNAFHEPAGQTNKNFNSGGVDNRVPDIATFNGISTQLYTIGTTAWIGGVEWDTHGTGIGTGGSAHSNYAFAGRVAYPALYERALTAEEVHDHYMTMSQEGNCVVSGEAPNFLTMSPNAGTNPKGLLATQKTRIGGQRGCDEMIIRDDTLNPPNNAKGQSSYTAVNPIRITEKGSAALRGKYFSDPIESISAGDARYYDGIIPNFNETGFGIITSLQVRREDGLAFGGADTNAAATFMDLTGMPQFDQPGGSADLDNIIGFKLSATDTFGIYLNTKFYSYPGTSTDAAIYNGSDISMQTSSGLSAKTPVERAKSQVLGFAHDTQAGKIHLSSPEIVLNVVSVTEIPDDGRFPLSQQNKYSMRTFQTSQNRSYPMAPWSASDNAWQVGPTALLMAGDGKAVQDISRKMTGATSKLRTRFASNQLRRHMGLSRMPAGSQNKFKKGSVHA